jgi:hypothetical protein
MGKVIINVGWYNNYSAAPANDDIACVVTGQTLEEIKSRMEESLPFHLEGMKEVGARIPEEFQGELDIEYHLNTRALLHYTEKLLPRKTLAHTIGISLQQLSNYANGWRNPRPDMQRRIEQGVHAIGEQLISVSCLF